MGEPTPGPLSGNGVDQRTFVVSQELFSEPKKAALKCHWTTPWIYPLHDGVVRKRRRFQPFPKLSGVREPSSLSTPSSLPFSQALPVPLIITSMNTGLPSAE